MRTTAEKKSLLLYYDYQQHFNFLSDEQVGKIIKSMLSYEIDGVFPEFDEPIMAMTFSFIKSNLDRDREKWLEMSERNKKNGKLGGRPPKSKSDVDEQINDELPEETTAESISSSGESETATLKQNFFSKYRNI